MGTLFFWIERNNMKSYALVLHGIFIMSVNTQRDKNKNALKKVINMSKDISKKVNKIDGNIGKMKNEIVSINDLKDDIVGEFNANFDEFKGDFQTENVPTASPFNINIRQ